MVTRVIKSRADRVDFDTLLDSYKYPYTVNLTKGKHVTYEQHKLENLWHREASEQLQDETPEEKRAFAKAYFGIPILCGESEEYRDAYNRIIRPLSYEQKLEMMAAPLDYPVTRLMTTGQKKRYMDDVRGHYESQGVKLTIPDDDSPFAERAA